jgi:hypothetical protein
MLKKNCNSLSKVLIFGSTKVIWTFGVRCQNVTGSVSAYGKLRGINTPSFLGNDRLPGMFHAYFLVPSFLLAMHCCLITLNQFRWFSHETHGPVDTQRAVWALHCHASLLLAAFRGIDNPLCDP